MMFRAVFSSALILVFIRGAHADRLPVTLATPAIHILVDKSERRLIVFRGGSIERVMKVSLGKNPQGAKTTRGDGRTPEGTYQISEKQTSTRYYRGLRISYPRPEDVERAKQSDSDAGGDIFIHGVRRQAKGQEESHRAFDWTDGCIAVTDAEMDELWRLVPVGTEITIRP